MRIRLYSHWRNAVMQLTVSSNSLRSNNRQKRTAPNAEQMNGTGDLEFSYEESTAAACRRHQKRSTSIHNFNKDRRTIDTAREV